MAKYGDLLVGLGALIYTILVMVLKDTGVTDLGAYIAQPALSGPFAMAALMRGWKTLKKAWVEEEEAKKASEADEDAPEGPEKEAEA